MCYYQKAKKSVVMTQYLSILCIYVYVRKAHFPGASQITYTMRIIYWQSHPMLRGCLFYNKICNGNVNWQFEMTQKIFFHIRVLNIYIPYQLPVFEPSSHGLTKIHFFCHYLVYSLYTRGRNIHKKANTAYVQVTRKTSNILTTVFQSLLCYILK